MRQRNQRSSSFTSSTLEPIYYLALSSELVFKCKAQISTLVKLVHKLPVFLWFAAIFPRCAPYLVCGKLLRGPQGPDNEVDISHQLIVKHQGVPKNRAGFTSKPQLLYNIESSHTAFAQRHWLFSQIQGGCRERKRTTLLLFSHFIPQPRKCQLIGIYGKFPRVLGDIFKMSCFGRSTVQTQVGFVYCQNKLKRLKNGRSK